jgi:hypothetical protein
MSFPNRDQLRKHVARTHEKRLRCEICTQESCKESSQGTCKANEGSSTHSSFLLGADSVCESMKVGYF